jgi:hypothetical protein
MLLIAHGVLVSTELPMRGRIRWRVLNQVLKYPQSIPQRKNHPIGGCKSLNLVALPGLEPGLFALRGRRVNQLHHNASIRSQEAVPSSASTNYTKHKARTQPESWPRRSVLIRAPQATLRCPAPLRCSTLNCCRSNSASSQHPGTEMSVAAAIVANTSRA